MNNWQPIETVPVSDAAKERIDVILWVADGGLDKKGDSVFGAVYKAENELIIKPDGYLGNFNATHWQPKPEQPKDI